MTIRIPYPIPPNERALLMQAGQLAAWEQRHAKVEKIITQIQARYGIEETAEGA